MPYDKNGREIMIGDTLKVFHFIGRRKKRYYMYKYVQEIKNYKNGASYLVIQHLSPKNETYHIPNNNKIYFDYEIIQGYGGNSVHFEDRPKLEIIKYGQGVLTCFNCEKELIMQKGKMKLIKAYCHEAGSYLINSEICEKCSSYEFDKDFKAELEKVKEQK